MVSDTKQDGVKHREEYFEIFQDYLFVLIPFVVSGYYSIRSLDVEMFFSQSEWAMASVGLLCQAVLKLLHVGKSPFVKNKNAHGFFFVLLLVFLVVSAIVLSDVMGREGGAACLANAAAGFYFCV
nr:hypothetical protein [uncultured Pseudogulbenkiania sp.]